MVQMTSTEAQLKSEGVQRDGFPWEILLKALSKLNYGGAENGISYFLPVHMEYGTTFQAFHLYPSSEFKQINTYQLVILSHCHCPPSAHLKALKGMEISADFKTVSVVGCKICQPISCFVSALSFSKFCVLYSSRDEKYFCVSKPHVVCSDGKRFYWGDIWPSSNIAEQKRLQGINAACGISHSYTSGTS